MIKFFYNPRFKYTNREIIDVSKETSFRVIDYVNIDSVDTINGHIIYSLAQGEVLPTYLVDEESGWRWFVSGITQLRTGKYQISLLRDIISEQPELWKGEEAYISAGTANNYNRYKRWDLPYTNTKVSEQRLNINGKSSFYVYYVNEQKFADNNLTEEDLEIKSASIPGFTGSFDYSVNNLNEIPSFEYVNAGTFQSVSSLIFNVYMFFRSGNNRSPFYTYDTTLGFGAFIENFSYGGQHSRGSNMIFIPGNVSNFNNNTNQSKSSTGSVTNAFVREYLSYKHGSSAGLAPTNLGKYVNKIIFDASTNKAYTIRQTTRTQNISDATVPNSFGTASLEARIRNINYSFDTGYTSSDIEVMGTSAINANYTLTTYTWTLEELGTATSFDFNFIANTRKLPKSAVRCVNIVASGDIEDSDVAQALMLAQTNGINEDNTTGRILDIQYLPFTIATTANENIKLNGMPLIAQFLDNDDLQFETNLATLTNINKETDTIKIVSPSRASQYLYRPYDNDGVMHFSTKVTLKPFHTVIYVRPDTSGLLLANWDDKDCLTILEDFSLTNVTSQWTEYIYTNRNYQNAFERQIQGREFERSWEREVEKANAASDSWNATNLWSQRVKTYSGNLPLVSNIAAGISAIAGSKDMDYMRAAQIDREYNEALYQEGLSAARDLFTMQLDNIKSQPLVPSKVTTIDCKFLDGIYLEFYSTNSTELEAINNYVKYNGNRIDDYGSFDVYWGHFVRGKIIKSNNYTQPEIDELNRRLQMGIFTEVKYGNQ